MFRRFSSAIAGTAVAARLYTPSAQLKEIYSSNFEKGDFPVNIAPSDSVLFAKYLYRAADAKKSYDAVLKDFQTIAAATSKLPVFWERNIDIDNVAEFKSLSEPTIFTLHWMQSNGMLDLLPDVAEVYETYVNAKQKRAIVKIYVGPGKEGDAHMAEGKKLGEQLQKEAAELAGYTLLYKKVIDTTIISGFAVELAGVYVNKAQGVQKAGSEGGVDIDYTALPAVKPTKTVWPDSIETEVLRKYLDNLALFDAEEAKCGV